MRASKEYIFTKEELEDWVEYIGGIGSVIDVFKNYYSIGEGDSINDFNYPVHPPLVIVTGIAKNGYGYWHVMINNMWCVLSLNMRDIKPVVKVNPYPNKCSVCHCPSRKIANVSYCSNMKCKTRKLWQKYEKCY